MFNVHASGGSQMIKEAVSATWKCSDESGKVRPVFLAVTVLTSLNNDDLKRNRISKKHKRIGSSSGRFG